MGSNDVFYWNHWFSRPSPMDLHQEPASSVVEYICDTGSPDDERIA